MTDLYKSNALSNEPYNGGFAITPSDSTVFDYPTRGIYVGSISGGATMRVIARDGTTVNFAGLVAGSVIPIRATSVHTTGTLASSLVGLY